MTALFWVDLWPLNGMKMTWYSACLLLLILFRTDGKKGHLDENDFRHCDGDFFSKVAFWKLLHHSYVRIVPSQQLRRHIDKSILRDTLQLYILRTWMNMRTKFFIKTSVNVTETKIDEGAWKKISHKKLQAWTWNNIWTKTETTFHVLLCIISWWKPRNSASYSLISLCCAKAGWFSVC